MQQAGDSQVNSSSTWPPQHRTFKFSQPREPSIIFDSNFDSGNMHQVIRNSFDHYSIWTASDAQCTNNQGYPKSWFYFSVGGFGNRKVSFSVHRVHFLFAMVKRNQMYRPVYRINYESGQQSEFDRLPYPILSLGLNQDQELVLKFDFVFNKLIKTVEFSFIYPYSYQQCLQDTLNWQLQTQNDKQLFFQVCQLAQSIQGRSIEMIVLSSHQGKQGYENFKNDKTLLLSQQKLTKFRNNKPIIFISARVHPIQTPSSYCMKGIIQFLLDKHDLRAHLLRKYFVFVLVPMLNPDGVANGYCRMDTLNQNLNRYYTTPDPEKQPSCYATKKLCEHYCKEKRLFMYLDLHAHPAYKGNFTFGNAIYDYIEQVQSQLFPKALSQNCRSFEFEQCIFSRKHMKAKDRNEDISKQGCGRVVFYKQFGLVHSYTLQCGYHLNTFDNNLQPLRNAQIKYQVKYRLNERQQKIYEQNQKVQQSEQSDIQSKNYDVFECVTHALDDANDAYYTRQLPTYTQETFYNLGRNILVSILDIWNKNPYSRCADLNGCRREIAEKQSKLDRFRKEQSGIKAKQKKVVQLIEEQLYGEWHRRNVFNALTLQSNARERKRNQTLQLQGKGKLQKEKTEKAIKGDSDDGGVRLGETMTEGAGKPSQKDKQDKLVGRQQQHQRVVTIQERQSRARKQQRVLREDKQSKESPRVKENRQSRQQEIGNGNEQFGDSEVMISSNNIKMIRGDKNDLTKSDTGLTENQSVNPVTIYRNTYIRQTGKGRMLPMMLQKQNKDGSTNIKMGIEEQLQSISKNEGGSSKIIFQAGVQGGNVRVRNFILPNNNSHAAGHSLKK